MISYTFQFSVIIILDCKEFIISVNVNIDNFNDDFTDDTAVKSSPWFCG